MNYRKTFIKGFPARPLFIDPMERESKYLPHLGGASLFYQEFYPKNSDIFKNINPDLSFGELSRILIHFTYDQKNFNRKNRVTI